MSGSNCPRCGSGSISVSETKTQVTHTCNKCGYSETQTKGKSAVANLASLLVSALILAVFAYGPIWMVAEVRG